MRRTDTRNLHNAPSDRQPDAQMPTPPSSRCGGTLPRVAVKRDSRRCARCPGQCAVQHHDSSRADGSRPSRPSEAPSLPACAVVFTSCFVQGPICSFDEGVEERSASAATSVRSPSVPPRESPGAGLGGLSYPRGSCREARPPSGQWLRHSISCGTQLMYADCAGSDREGSANETDAVSLPWIHMGTGQRTTSGAQAYRRQGGPEVHHITSDQRESDFKSINPDKYPIAEKRPPKLNTQGLEIEKGCGGSSGGVGGGRRLTSGDAGGAAPVDRSRRDLFGLRVALLGQLNRQ
ncbi:hypothetical protein SKAU_G00119940 [Synaphobranchus kaupii]|uniref:Uncharacterized protein n=1 Tax=Synaphobranchus kaupii TaxID=118154 RepID=A0A9Q1FNI2_SYNKA|nr:hypothetical protein SKAU_G00119940 [Synaphobranchus kaupii]